MFNEYNPINKLMFQVIDNHGKIIDKKLMPKVTDERVLKAYKDMLFTTHCLFQAKVEH
jgi:hypothetical protein